MPYTETTNALTVAMRDWVMHETPMPLSQYPTLSAGTLVPPTKSAMGFPPIPNLPPIAPNDFINPGIVYDFGPGFNAEDQTGIISVQPADDSSGLLNDGLEDGHWW